MSDWTRELVWNWATYAALAIVAGIIWYLLFLFHPSLRKGLFVLPRLPPVRWAGHEVILAFCVMYGMKVLVVVTLQQIGFFLPLLGAEPDQKTPAPASAVYNMRCEVIAGPLVLVMTLVVLFGVFYARTGARPHAYLLTWARWPANIACGILCFVLMTPIVLGIHLVAGLILGERPHHLTVLAYRGLPDWEWLLLGFQAVAAAPLLEEIVFRGILLGWLRRTSLTGHFAIMTMTLAASYSGIRYYDFQDNASKFDPAPLVFGILLAGAYGFQLYRVARQFGLTEEELASWQVLPSPMPEDVIPEKAREVREYDEQRAFHWKQANARQAIIGTAMLFACMHAPAWPAPIALFAMGFVLAAVAQRTQSLLGPIVFHALLNLIALIALYGTVTSR